MKISSKIALIIFIISLIGAALVYLAIRLPLANQPLLFQLTLIILLVILLTLTIWALINKIIIKPILHLNSITKLIAGGNLGKRVDIASLTSTDEIGELSKNINTIINNLAHGFQHLANSLRDEKVHEKLLASNLRELETQKAQDDALLTSIGDGIVAIDQNQKIILFNKEAAKLTEYAASEALYENYSQILRFLNEKDQSPVNDFISQGFQGQRITNPGPIVIQSKHNKLNPVSSTVAPITDSSGHTLGVIIVLRDASRERELNRMKDEFVSVVSHELRTPMTAIKGLISMIFEGDYGPVNEDLKDPLNDVALSVNRLILLVNDILDVSRIESGRLKLNMGDIDILDMVEEVNSMMKLLAQQKGVKIDISGCQSNLAKTDPAKTKEILFNLIGNAVKFTDTGQITISTEKDADMLKVSVADSGIGIARADQAKLFNKFQQLASGQTNRPVGTGLGLYIAREFSRKMGGDLWLLSSVPGQGSVFTFTLPLSGTHLAKEVADKILQSNPNTP